MKNVVITGSTRGIGLAMAVEFLKAGCNVTLSGRGGQLNDTLMNSISSYKENIIYVQCNVQSKDSIQELWDESIKRWGHVDIWINNAGQNTAHVNSWETIEAETIAVIQTNLTGMIFGSQIASVGMLKQGFGAIYSMEGLGLNNMIQVKTIHYGTTKHALTYYMKGLAKELKGTGVIAGRLSPGMMLTDFITKNQDGSPSEVIANKSFIKIFNILADTPDMVAKFFVPRILSNTKNNVQIAWLTNGKTMWRFMTAGLRKDRLLK